MKNYNQEPKLKKRKRKIFQEARFLSYTCVCVRERRKIVLFPDMDAVKHLKIAFKGIFSPVERILYVWWTIYPLCSRKCLITLKNAFLLF